MNKWVCLTIFFSTNVFGGYNFAKDFSLKKVNLDRMAARITHEVFASDQWPDEVEYEGRTYLLKYRFDKDLTDRIKLLMRRYPSDYTSVVVIDNKTGSILSAIDYDKKLRKYGKNITFSSTHPAASIFKVVTAANLLEEGKVDIDTPFVYNGRSSTLYKSQLKPRRPNKWTRHIDFGKAFALSNNVVFGKAAINNSSYEGLNRMAYKFGFNENVTSILQIGNSKLFQDDDEYGLAELATGFNRQTMISPVHGATIASVIANGGQMRSASVVTEIKDAVTGRVVWQNSPKSEQVLSVQTAEKLQEMMGLTVSRGTARGAFRRWLRRNSDFTLGGKTGSITGGLPYGKRDWFVSYASPTEKLEDGISICVMIVNVEKWYIKSTVFTREIIDYYYGRKRS
ncbi:MAG: hypothetical protein CME65_09560 [Halobacteriovoraceae bacterium]|nr:hypothetical protein [Halobacteriovoraceae bacterium]|tara:strand:- start:21489 stop:22679 length:1191 start_codon:yes stop_codon:yes gene_type:complete